MNSLVEYARNELDIIEQGCEDEESKKMQQQIDGDIMQIIQMFSEQGHTGFTANYAIGILEKLLKYHPLTQIEDTPDQWIQVNDNLYQHKRCFSVFKDNGETYNMEGKLFSEDGGKSWFSSKGSRVPITFPYIVPDKPERVLLDEK